MAKNAISAATRHCGPKKTPSLESPTTISSCCASESLFKYATYQNLLPVRDDRVTMATIFVNTLEMTRT
jgi:hypothetical protein